MSLPHLRLGVNIDHVATVRNARGGAHPDPVRAAMAAEAAGADGITAHLREDRRHIRDADMYAIRQAVTVPLNFEMAATDEMVGIALDVKPNAACIVPERREEVTTEGGLAVAGRESELEPYFTRIRDAGIRLSLFIEASERSAPLLPSAPTLSSFIPAVTAMMKAAARQNWHGSGRRRNSRTRSAWNAMAGMAWISIPSVRSRRSLKCMN